MKLRQQIEVSLGNLSSNLRRRGALKKILENEVVVVDIGAHKGEFCSTLPRKDLELICVEPISDFNKFIFEQAHRKRFRVTVINAVVSDTKEEYADFFVNKGTVGSSLLEPIPGSDSSWLTKNEIRRVRQISLVELLETSKRQEIGLLKIDTQGTDLQVIKSAGNLLDARLIRAVLVEVNFHNFYYKQDSYFEIFRYLEERGYFFADIYPTRNRKGWLFSADVLFLPRSAKYTTV